MTGVARGEDALTVLDNPHTRNLFIDDLMEVAVPSSFFLLLSFVFLF